MLYCAAEPLMGLRNDIAFPQQLEIKINQDEVKANFKGLKNKPGSTRPADVTDMIRKLAGYKNIIQVTYALTSKASLPSQPSQSVRRMCLLVSPRTQTNNIRQKFHFIAMLVKKHTAEELTERIRRGYAITKQRVINESEFGWLGMSVGYQAKS